LQSSLERRFPRLAWTRRWFVFGENLCYVLLLVFVIIAALTAAGVATTSFIAVLGAAGLAVGLALQGSVLSADLKKIRLYRVASALWRVSL